MLKWVLMFALMVLPGVAGAADEVLSSSDRDALQQLDLKADQWQQINQLVVRSEQRIQAIRNQEQSISNDLNRISRGNGDASSIPVLAGKRAALAADRLKVRAGVRSRLNSILTPAQSSQLRQLLDQNVPVGSGGSDARRHSPSAVWPSRP